MTRKSNFTSSILFVFLLTTISVYGQKDTNATFTKQEKVGNLTIDTFSSFPPEIEGCSCYFSNNPTELKKEKYIYVNDFAQTSFLKINGVMSKFTQIEYKKINKTTIIAKFKSMNYEMIIEVKDEKKSGEETSIKTGTITLTDKKGNIIMRNFYGECGC